METLLCLILSQKTKKLNSNGGKDKERKGHGSNKDTDYNCK